MSFNKSVIACISLCLCTVMAGVSVHVVQTSAAERLIADAAQEVSGMPDSIGTLILPESAVSSSSPSSVPVSSSSTSDDTSSDAPAESSEERTPAEKTEIKSSTPKITDAPEYKPSPEDRKEDGKKEKPVLEPEPPKDTVDQNPGLPPKPDGDGQTGGTSSQPASSQPQTTTPDPSFQPIGDGWRTVDGKVYLYQNGSPLTGLQTIGGLRYHFDSAGVLLSKVGIDVSEHQATINWEKVKAAGVDFAMIRVGWRGWESGKAFIDANFTKNIQGALNNGIKCGVYFYTQAITESEAREEAAMALEALRAQGITPDKLALPVAYDIEYAHPDSRMNSLNTAQRTNLCNAFNETVRAAGYKAMVYSNKDWLDNMLQVPNIRNCDFWLAHWISGVSSYKGSYTMWQYSSQGRISGINGDVDLNLGYF